LQKLGVRARTQAALRARELGILWSWPLWCRPHRA